MLPFYEEETAAIRDHERADAHAANVSRSEYMAEVIVAEGPGHWRNVEYLVQASGLGDVLRHYNVPFVDLNHDDLFFLPNRMRFTEMAELGLPATLRRADLIV